MPNEKHRPREKSRIVCGRGTGSAFVHRRRPKSGHEPPTNHRLNHDPEAPMKTTRVFGAALLATSVLFTAACGDDDDDPTGTDNTATVRFVNTTGQNIDVGMNGTFAGNNSNVAFANG